MKKRITALLLALAMVLCLMPQAALAADAEDIANEQLVELAEETAPHIHSVCCGSEVCPDCQHTDVEWSAISTPDQVVSALKTSGYYYLTQNVTIPGGTTLNDAAVDTHICLNGFNITQSGTNNIIAKISAGTISITNCKEGTDDAWLYGAKVGSATSNGATLNGAAFQVNGANAVLNMYGGNFTGHTSGGGIVDIQNGGVFNMYGGVIRDNAGSYKDGVLTLGTGCGVYIGRNTNAATFNMYGGKISNNKGTNGSAVLIGGKGKFNMFGGEFSNNESTKNGGALYVSSGAVASISNAKFSGNQITGTESGCLGGAIYCTGGDLSVENTVFENNKVLSAGSTQGGAIGIAKASKTYNITDCTFTGNKAVYGGAIACASSMTLNITDCVFTGNEGTNGGALYTAGAPAGVVLTDTVMTGNTSTNYGAIYGKDTVITVAGGNISGNTASKCNNIGFDAGSLKVTKAPAMNGAIYCSTMPTLDGIAADTNCYLGKTADESENIVFPLYSADEEAVFSIDTNRLKTGYNVNDEFGFDLYVKSDKDVYVTSLTLTFDEDWPSCLVLDEGGVTSPCADEIGTVFTAENNLLRYFWDQTAQPIHLEADKWFRIASFTGNAASDAGNGNIAMTVELGQYGGEEPDEVQYSASVGVYDLVEKFVPNLNVTSGNEVQEMSFYAKYNETGLYSDHERTAAITAADLNCWNAKEGYLLPSQKWTTDSGSYSTDEILTRKWTESETFTITTIKNDGEPGDDPLHPHNDAFYPHATCGASCTHTPTHGVVPEWVDLNAQIAGGSYTLAGGCGYILTDDLTLTNSLIVTSGEVTLCLNGYDITASANRPIDMQGGVLNITDCSSEPGSIISTKDAQGSVILFRAASVAETINLYNVTLSGINTSDIGGVVMMNGNADFTFNMYSGKLTGNTTAKKGGAVYMHGAGTFNMYGGEISGNTATNGGAVYVNASPAQVNLYGGEIKDNTAQYGGGVMVNAGGTDCVNFLGTKLSGNEGTVQGGAVYLNSCSAFIDGSEFIDNSSPKGGAFYLNGSAAIVEMDDGHIDGNEATAAGGAVFIAGANASFTMNDGSINNNTSVNAGGAARLEGQSSKFIMNGGEIKGNSANGSPAIHTVSGKTQTVKLLGGEISGNDATNSTYAISIQNGTLELADVAIKDNTSSKTDGGIFFNGASLKVGGALEITGNKGAQLCNNVAAVAIEEDPDNKLTNELSVKVNTSGCKDGNSLTVANTTSQNISVSNVPEGYRLETNYTEGCLKLVPATEDEIRLYAKGYEKWTSTTTLPKISGKFFLADDVVLATANELKGTAGALLVQTLDLNGKQISNSGASATASNHRIFGLENADLTIDDSVGTGKVIGDSDSNIQGAAILLRGSSVNKLTINGGEYTGLSGGALGAIIMANANPASAVVINGGKITGNTGKPTTGAAIDSRSNITINGGVITGNEGTHGAVYVTGATLTVNAGADISGNTGYDVYYATSASFINNGGNVEHVYSEEFGNMSPVTIDGIEYQRWDGDALPTKSGNYYLTKDYSLNSHWAVNNGKVIRIHMNGHTIAPSETSTGRALRLGGMTGDVKVPASLTLCGKGFIEGNAACTAKGGFVYIDDNCVFTLESASACDAGTEGSVTMQNGVASSGSAVYVANGTFNMNAGTIKNCNATSSAAVIADHAESVINISGGTIELCTSEAGGAAIRATKGMVSISDAVISNCHAGSTGGAICVVAGCQTYMKNVTITGCSSKNAGGAIRVVSGAELILENVKVSNCNSDAVYGGAVSNDGTITLKGNCVISDNLANGKDSNLWVGANGKIVHGLLGDGANVGIDPYQDPTYFFVIHPISDCASTAHLTLDGADFIFEPGDDQLFVRLPDDAISEKVNSMDADDYIKLNPDCNVDIVALNNGKLDLNGATVSIDDVFGGKLLDTTGGDAVITVGNDVTAADMLSVMFEDYLPVKSGNNEYHIIRMASEPVKSYKVQNVYGREAKKFLFKPQFTNPVAYELLQNSVITDDFKFGFKVTWTDSEGTHEVKNGTIFSYSFEQLSQFAASQLLETGKKVFYVTVSGYDAEELTSLTITPYFVIGGHECKIGEDVVFAK